MRTMGRGGGMRDRQSVREREREMGDREYRKKGRRTTEVYYARGYTMGKQSEARGTQR